MLWFVSQIDYRNELFNKPFVTHRWEISPSRQVERINQLLCKDRLF